MILRISHPVHEFALATLEQPLASVLRRGSALDGFCAREQRVLEARCDDSEHAHRHVLVERQRIP